MVHKQISECQICDDSQHELCIVPGTLLANQIHIRRGSCLWSRELPRREGGLIGYQNLRQHRLDVRAIANESDMG